MKTEAELRKLLNSTLPGLPRLRYENARVWLETAEAERELGIISYVEETGALTYLKNDSEEQIYQKTYAWSIPVIIVLAVDQIVIQTGQRTYHISQRDAIQYGEKLQYGKSTEQKYYIPLDYWHITCESRKEQALIERLGASWYSKLYKEFDQLYMVTLSECLIALRRSRVILPASSDVFKAFRLCGYHQTRVVILGQDPYPAEGDAHGLAFSTGNGRTPFSLQQIFRELKQEYEDSYISEEPNLERWTKQGVLLLNRILTVQANNPASHTNMGWEKFTEKVIKHLNAREQPVVFMLWGNYAQEAKEWIDGRHHMVLESSHPAKERHNPGSFLGNGHFKKANAFLKRHHGKEIAW